VCDTDAIVREGSRAATAAGANLAAYGQVIYMFPFNSGCSWSGTGAVGAGGEKIVFINGDAGFSLKTLTHELGHGFGLAHSNGLDCDASPLGSTCTLQEYADPSDTMGNRAGHYNAIQKERLGWLGTAGGPAITTVAASGRYTLEPYETYGQGTKALKVLRSVDAATGQKTWYYLEYRQPVGFDALLAGRGNLAGGVLIHRGNTANGIANNVLLDMTPNTVTTSKSSDFEDGALTVGATFRDAAADVSITLVAADAGAAVVDVSVSAPPSPDCVRAAPLLQVAGPEGAVTAGTSVAYTVTLANRDSSACAPTTFTLAGSVPQGWTGALAATSMTLGAGSSTGTRFSVASPAGATAAQYSIGIGSASTVGSVHVAHASATYAVASAQLSESVATDKPSYLRGESVRMSAIVKRDGVAIAGVAVRFTVTLPGGGATALSAMTGADGFARATYKLGKGKSALGAYGLRADAGTATAATSFSVR